MSFTGPASQTLRAFGLTHPLGRGSHLNNDHNTFQFQFYFKSVCEREMKAMGNVVDAREILISQCEKYWWKR